MSRVDWRTGSHRSTSDRDTSPAPIRFPPDNFKHSLTLFSKSFSSFPRGTCSLSVLSPIFSLGRNLPPDWGCIPKQPDSPTAPRGATGSGHDGALTLSGAPFQGTWARKLKGSRSKCERKPCMIGLEDHSTTIYHGAFHQGLIFQPTTRQCLWEANLHPTKYLIGKGIGVGGTLCDTQAGVPST
ncbi:hypothetical protein VNO77_38814 [Canavalia gladiata]|uniref:Uncharacterized protein n=1 Tax=Canavalia gladiata TaxID=3824 RepID=A0AAN9PWK4_CANGL